MRASLPFVTASLACTIFAVESTAIAQTQPTGAQNISDARNLATAGIQLQNERRYAECADKFAAAHTLYPEATTVTIRLAQCLAASGKLVEGGEAYRTLAQTPVAANAPAQFKQAQQQGKVEADALEQRIPILTIGVDPTPPPSGTQLHMQHAVGNAAPTVDVLDAAWINVARKVNPGTYTVFATAPGYASKAKQVVIAEGEKKTEALTLSAGETAPVVAGTATKVAGPNEAPAPFVGGPQAPVVLGATNNGFMLGLGATVAQSGGDNIDGASVFGHVHGWLRLRKFLLGGVLEYRALPGDGRRVDTYYAGVHAGMISTPQKKVALWLDGGLGLYGDKSSSGFGGQFGIGPSFPLARTVRLVAKGVLGFGVADRSMAYAGLSVDLEFEIPFGQPQPIQ